MGRGVAAQAGAEGLGKMLGACPESSRGLLLAGAAVGGWGEVPSILPLQDIPDESFLQLWKGGTAARELQSRKLRPGEACSGQTAVPGLWADTHSGPLASPFLSPPHINDPKSRGALILRMTCAQDSLVFKPVVPARQLTTPPLLSKVPRFGQQIMSPPWYKYKE